MITLDTNINAKGATSQYLSDLDSMVKIGNKFFCASGDGLFLIDGNQDDGVDLNSYFETPLMDFGLPNEKRLRFVYVGYEAVSAITLTVTTELGLSDTYSLPATTDLQSGHRVTISRKLRGRYWKFKFSGANFAVDAVSVLPIVRGHRF